MSSEGEKMSADKHLGVESVKRKVKSQLNCYGRSEGESFADTE